MQRDEQPQTLTVDAAAAMWLEALRGNGRVVLLLGRKALGAPEPREAGEPGDPVEAWRLARPTVEWHLEALKRPPLLVELLARLRDAGLVSRIIYTGRDGLLARLLGETVLDLYGSLPRARCPRCGRRRWLDGIPGEPPSCPGCGWPMAPDAVWRGSPPPRRLLGEAIYEATTADLLVACCLDRETLPVTLALGASRFTRLLLVGEDWLPLPPGSRRVEAGLNLLAETVLRASTGRG